MLQKCGNLFLVIDVVECGRFSLSEEEGLSDVQVLQMEAPLHMDFKDKCTASRNLKGPFIQNAQQN